jgi:predicted secreted protein
MTEAAKNITNLRPPEQDFWQNTPSEPWLRQKSEPATWYMRFKRYLDLGPKRSLRKALADEPETQKATKGTGKKQETKNLSDVSVPGAWKRASKLWRWVERAEAYDLAQMEKQAGYIRQVVKQHPFASKAYRIIQLCCTANALLEYAKQGMSLEESVAYAKTMQSLIKDIEHAMEGMDETTLIMADAAAYKYFVDLADKQRAKS